MTEPFYDAARDGRRTAAGTTWRFAADRVMGGVSRGTLELSEVDGRSALVLDGEVSLENGGGFVQANVDLSSQGARDLRGVDALELDLLGDGGVFVLLLKTLDLQRPWQSYRAELRVPETWTTHRVELSRLRPHRTEAPLDLQRVRRVGVAALGRPGRARLAIAQLRLCAS